MIDSLLNSVTDDSLAKTPPNFNYEVKTCQEDSQTQHRPSTYSCFQFPFTIPAMSLSLTISLFFVQTFCRFWTCLCWGWTHHGEGFIQWRSIKAPYGVQFQLHPVQNFKAFLRVNIPGGNLNALMPLESGGKLVQQVETPWRTHEGCTGRSPSWERKFNKHVDKHIFYCTGEPGDQF